MILGLKYQLILTTFKDLRYFPKNKQNEVQIPCSRSIKHNKANFSKFKAFPLLVFGFSYSKLMKSKEKIKGCLRYLKIWKYIKESTYLNCWPFPVLGSIFSHQWLRWVNFGCNPSEPQCRCYCDAFFTSVEATFPSEYCYNWSDMENSENNKKMLNIKTC